MDNYTQDYLKISNNSKKRIQKNSNKCFYSYSKKHKTVLRSINKKENRENRIKFLHLITHNRYKNFNNNYSNYNIKITY